MTLHGISAASTDVKMSNMVGNIRLYRLVNNEQVLGRLKAITLDSQGAGVHTIVRPFALVVRPSGVNQVSIDLIPYGVPFFEAPNELSLSTNMMIYHANATKNMVDMYTQMVLSVPASHLNV